MPTTVSMPVIEPLAELAEPAESRDGEFCEIPPHHEQLIMNRRVDADLV